MADEKDLIATASPTLSESATSNDEIKKGSATEPQVGELRPGEAEAGGLGRHLGLFSTTFLM